MVPACGAVRDSVGGVAAMVRKSILMPVALIEVVAAVASERRVSFGEAARLLIARGAQAAAAGHSNPFDLDDAVLEGFFGMAADSARHAVASIDDLLMTIEARDRAGPLRDDADTRDR